MLAGLVPEERRFLLNSSILEEQAVADRIRSESAQNPARGVVYLDGIKVHHAALWAGVFKALFAIPVDEMFCQRCREVFQCLIQDRWSGLAGATSS